MKQFAAIGMFLLLLYHTGAESVAVLFFEDYYTTSPGDQMREDMSILKLAIPSLPYTSHWEDDQVTSSMIREGDQFFNLKSLKIQADTLYVVMQENLSAKERFFSLVQGVHDLVDQGMETNSTKRDWLRGLKNLTKVYNHQSAFLLLVTDLGALPLSNLDCRLDMRFYQPWILGLDSPPPELTFTV